MSDAKPLSSSLSRTEFGQLCKRDTRTVQRWIDDGMPCERRGKRYVIDPAKAIPWVIQFMDRGTASTGSHRDRLAKAQADRAEIENAVRRGELLLLEHVAKLWTGAEAALATNLDGVAGRLAKDCAGEPNPATIRKLLLDEHRRIRGAYARALAKLFERPPTGSDPGGDPKPAAKKKRKRVGKRKPGTTGKRKR